MSTIELQTTREQTHIDSLYTAADFLPFLRAFLGTLGEKQTINAKVWNNGELWRMLRTHKIVPYVAQAVSTEPFGINEVGVKTITEYKYLNISRNVKLARTLVRILSDLSHKGIEVMPFKGLVLAQFLYGDISKRQCWDIDLLVRKKDAALAISALIELGFKPLSDVSDWQQRAIIHYASTLTFQNPVTRELVDLHWGIDSYSFKTFTENEIFDGSISLDFEGISVRTLHPDVLLYFLCHHGYRHNWAELSLSVDVAAYVIKYDSANWSHILQEYRDRGALLLVLSGLFLAERLFDIELPRVVKDVGIRENIDDINAGLYQSSVEPSKQQANQQHNKIIKNIGVRASAKQKLLYLNYYIKPKTFDIVTVDLPPALHFFYYWVRLVNVLKRYF